MDKLSKNIRRPGGDLVAPKRPHGQRLLLPTEKELCKLLNLTEKEYWFFVDTTAAYNGQRPKGYELIPDIRCDPVTSLFTTKVLVQIGIAVAAATVSYLLTPKPKEQKQGGSRRTADSIGNTRFSPQASFNSIQELANIGDAIPLIFANQIVENPGKDNELVFGGLRVNSQLLWSQFVSLGKYQQLKALTLFSHGTIAATPDYEGFAVGDTLLNTYNAHKVGLYFRNGSESNDNRITKDDVYSGSKLRQDRDDPFEVGVPNKAGTTAPKTTSKSFCGARNPTTQTVFGCYAPIPNAQICRLPYELIRDPRGSTKESIKDLMRKRKKHEFAKFPTRAGIVKINNITSKGLHSVNIDDEILYQIVGLDSGENNALQRVYDADPSTTGNQETEAGDAFNYRPHGVADVDNLTTQIRSTTDNILIVGEQYLFGTAIVICTEADTTLPWGIEITKSYTFKVVEPGEVDIPVDNANLATHCANPVFYDPNTLGFGPGGSSDRDPLYSLSDLSPIFYQQIISDTEFNFPRATRDLYYAHDIYTAQRVAFATVTNNRKCDVTEIGIKSKVFKRIQFANVQSQPDEAALKRAFDDRTQITLGQVNTFADRISLFMLQVREIGSSNWTDLINNTVSDHTGLFAVKGNTPEFQYNAITISHPKTEQYEYRFKPFPGNYITRNEKWNKAYNLLYTDGGGDTQVSHFNSNTSFGTFDVAFSGNEEFRITESTASNDEYVLGPSNVTTQGFVQSVTNSNGTTTFQTDPSFNGEITRLRWVDVENDTNPIAYKRIVLWNSSNSSLYAGTSNHHWQLYFREPGQSGFELSNYVVPNNNGSWPDVFFYRGQFRYKPSDPGEYFHPNNNDHQFFVTKQAQQTFTETVPSLAHFNGLVNIQDGSGTGLKINLNVQKFEYQTSPSKFHYNLSWTIDPSNIGTGYKQGDQVFFNWTDADSNVQRINLIVNVSASQTTSRAGQNFNPFDVLTDWNVYSGDENSNRSEPESEIVYVNEILKPAVDNFDVEQPAKYSNLAFAGIQINSSKEWTNFSQFSAYFKKGVEIENLNTGLVGPSNLFPEIAFALLTSTKIGAGKLVGVDSVDKQAMADAAKFCQVNEFFWDGIISSRLNLRDFIFEHAGYCLLDFTIIGGQFSLKPSVQINSESRIDKTIKPFVKCLFTDGNINDLQVSFLSPEERQAFKAVVLYREEKVNGFPETKSLLIRENNVNGSDDLPIETFDLSGFCTSRIQAKYYAYFALRSRRLVDHGIVFKTAPQYVVGLSPGDYFRLVSEATHTSRFRNGAKSPTGTIVSKDPVADSEEVFYWVPGTEGVLSGTLGSIPNGVLFTVKNTTTENKIYKCETISYSEDGLLEVSGSYAPVESNGELSVMQNWGLNDEPSGFIVLENN